MPPALRLFFLDTEVTGSRFMLLGKKDIVMTASTISTKHRAKPAHQQPIHMGSLGLPAAATEESAANSASKGQELMQHECTHLAMESLVVEGPQQTVVCQ